MRPKDRLGVVDLEATNAGLVAEAARRLDGNVGRIRLLGALALALCQLADGRLDGVCYAQAVAVGRRGGRRADRARGRCGRAAARPPDDLPLDLAARSRIVAARDVAMATRLADLVYG